MERTFLGEMPARIARLPVSERGFPVPKFVAWMDKDRKMTAVGQGTPDFRVSNLNHLGDCIRRRVCWLCGEPLGRHMAFVLGPMCCLNRNTSEPPCHLDCATWAVRNCPFLSRPDARRNERELPHDRFVAGVGIARNPGVTCIWVTQSYSTRRAFNDGILFEPGEPEELFFWRESRTATRAEIDESIDTGWGALVAADGQSPSAVAHLNKERDRFNRMLDKVPHAA